MSQHIIIGATGSVGSALAHKLHGLGHDLHLVGRNESKLEDLAKELDATYACADACDEHALSQAVIQGCTEDTRGLAYCVGSIDLRPLNKWDMKSFLNVYALNVAGVLVAIKNAADTLKKMTVLWFFSQAFLHVGAFLNTQESPPPKPALKV